MLQSSVLLIFLALILAVVIVYYQYFYKNALKSKYDYLLSFLRFITFFSILVLLINPQIKQRSFQKIKPKLLVAIDNSTSIKNLKQDSIVKILAKEIRSDNNIRKKFEIELYSFGSQLKKEENFDFNENQTNIYNAVTKLNNLYINKIAPIILLSDGNQTYGNNYTFYKSKQKIFPVIIGDTTSYIDLKIDNINVNTYTFIDHNFPVEIFINYQGKQAINSKLEIFKENKIVYKQKLNFTLNKTNNHKTITLPAQSKGKHYYKAVISPLDNEINKINNIYNFSIEVLDEKSEILLLYDVLHPDIGFWKRTIESNQQKKLTINHISEYKNNLSEYQYIILYQPNNKFKKVFSHIQDQDINFLLQTGSKTDWNFLNQNQNLVYKDFTNSTQNINAVYNTDFTIFQTTDIDFEKLPPLQNLFGDIKINKPHQNLLYQKINNIQTESPLLTIFQQNNNKNILLFGENIYTWRSFSYKTNKSFDNFDNFTNNIFQFLQYSKKKNRLEVKYQPYYFANETIKIRSNYYDANYIFDKNANLELGLTEQKSKNKRNIPFVLMGNSFELNLKNLSSGIYDFVVKSNNDKQRFKGSFTVLDYSVEQQNIQSNFNDLQNLAKNSGGLVFLSSQMNDLINKLSKSEDYVVVQQEITHIKALINWKWLLALIVLSLGIEWFVRKYNGLI
ncbi:MAG: VWA domain-containing protein [Bacteroidota bacterium]